MCEINLHVTIIKKLESGNYYLDSDVTLSDMITILENKTVTIDLNGHVLKKA